jgi:hypothetical protein
MSNASASYLLTRASRLGDSNGGAMSTEPRSYIRPAMQETKASVMVEVADGKYVNEARLQKCGLVPLRREAKAA